MASIIASFDGWKNLWDASLTASSILLFVIPFNTWRTLMKEKVKKTFYVYASQDGNIINIYCNLNKLFTRMISTIGIFFCPFHSQTMLFNYELIIEIQTQILNYFHFTDQNNRSLLLSIFWYVQIIATSKSIIMQNEAPYNLNNKKNVRCRILMKTYCS